jgi:hypothetical protein
VSAILIEAYRNFPQSLETNEIHRDTILREFMFVKDSVFGFWVLTAVTRKSAVFWVLSPCSFGRTYRLHLRGRRVSQARDEQKQAVSSSEMLELILPPASAGF